MDGASIARLGLVVHPRRELSGALETVRRWSGAHGVDVVQVPASGQERSVADPGDPATCDVILALGGDGTTLAALRRSEEHTSELQSRGHLVCRLLLEKKKHT